MIALSAAVAMTPTPAEACGGTFCDGVLPGDMPVNQTGETILFALDNGFVEAHVQIEYDGGDAEQFAWLVPVPEIPEVEVGSWRLVQSALAATVPVYGFENNWVCEDMDPPPSTTGVGFINNPDGGGTSEPEVVAEDVVGAFQYVVLQGGTSDSVTEWLLDNGYSSDTEAPAILDEYITEGHVFVAFRLRHGLGVEDIHPVVIRYPGTEACIPIRLTAVAAEEDMRIRALFLGEDRVVPTNYRHVQLNRTRLNWLGLGSNYDNLVSMAVDAPGADGRAFVTEYAGASSEVDTTLLDTSSYDSSVFTDMPVVEVVDTLEQQDLVSCSGPTGCIWLHELASSLVHEFIPVPEGLTDGEFYSCLSCYAALIDAEAWDAEAFMAAYDERIIAPMQHANDLLTTWPYLTRLYTTISPHEMTSDPMFTENPDLDDVPNRHGAQRNQACCGNAMQLPGGRIIALEGTGSAWPDWPEEMPWAERVEEFTVAGGPPISLVDETANIDAMIATWNAPRLCSDDDMGTGSSTEGGDETSDGPTPPGTTSGVGDGTSGGDGSSGSEAGQDDTAAGCACNSTSRAGGMGWALMLAGMGLGAMRRRRLR